MKFLTGALKTARPPRGSASSHGFQSVAAQKWKCKMKFKMNGVIRESPAKNLLLILLSILLWVCSGHSTRVPNLGKSNSCFPSSLSASMACKGFTWLAMVCMTRHNGIAYCFATSTWPKRNTSNKQTSQKLLLLPLALPREVFPVLHSLHSCALQFLQVLQVHL